MSGIRKHIMSKHEDQSHVCEYCDKIIKRSDSIKKHVKLCQQKQFETKEGGLAFKHIRGGKGWLVFFCIFQVRGSFSSPKESHFINRKPPFKFNLLQLYNGEK